MATPVIASIADQSWTVGVEVNLNIAITGIDDSDVDHSVEVSGLYAGLYYNWNDSMDRVEVRGTPESLVGEEVFTVTAINDDGTAMRDANWEVVPSSPVIDSFGPFNLVRGQPFEGQIPIANIPSSVRSDGEWVGLLSEPNADGAMLKGMLPADVELTVDSVEVEVVALNGAGMDTESGVINIRDTGTPTPPQNIVGMAIVRGIGLTFEAPEHDGNLTITDYSYRYKRSDADTYSDWEDTGSTALEANIRGLGVLTEYDIQLAAVNSAGRGRPSAAVRVTTSNRLNIYVYSRFNAAQKISKYDSLNGGEEWGVDTDDYLMAGNTIRYDLYVPKVVGRSVFFVESQGTAEIGTIDIDDSDGSENRLIVTGDSIVYDGNPKHQDNRVVPVFSDGIYGVSHSGTDGDIIKFDISDGSEIFRIDFPSEYTDGTTLVSVIVSDGIYGYYRHSERSINRHVVKYNLTTGTEIWDTTLQPTGSSGFGDIFRSGASNPFPLWIVIDGAVYLYDYVRRELSRYDASDGSSDWRVSAPIGLSNRDKRIFADSSGVYIITSSDGTVRKVNASDGSQAWEAEAGITAGVDHSVLASDGLYVANLSGIAKMNLNSGNVSWTYSDTNFLRGNSRLLVRDGDGLYFVNEDDQVKKVSLLTGQEIWSTQLPSTSSDNEATLRYAHGLIYTVEWDTPSAYLLNAETGLVVQSVSLALAGDSAQILTWNIG